LDWTRVPVGTQSWFSGGVGGSLPPFSTIFFKGPGGQNTQPCGGENLGVTVGTGGKVVGVSGTSFLFLKGRWDTGDGPRPPLPYRFLQNFSTLRTPSPVFVSARPGEVCLNRFFSGGLSHSPKLFFPLWTNGGFGFFFFT